MGETTEDPTVPTQDPTADPTNPDGNSGASTSEEVDPQVIDALTIASVETIANSASFAMANLFQHQVNHHRRLDSLNEALLGRYLKKFSTPDPVDAISTSHLFMGESVSSINSLLAQLSSAQLGGKIAQSTPGDLASEISKMGAAVSSLQSLIGGLTAVLQATMKDQSPSVSFQKKASPIPTPVPTPSPAPVDEKNSGRLDDDKLKFPKVTVKFSNGKI